MVDDPWVHVVRLVQVTNTPTSRFFNGLIYNDNDDIGISLEQIQLSISESGTSGRVTYKLLKPNFKVHNVYNTRRFVNEIHRVSFTRLRVCRHSLAVETGRWNRRGRERVPLPEFP